MNKIIVCLLLVCLAALSIVYVCSSLALFSQPTQFMETVSSEPIALTEELFQHGKPFYPAPIPVGDPVDNPIPHKQ